MKQDEAVRSFARKGYEVSKFFKEAGLKFRKVIPASTDMSVRKLFKLPLDSDLLCLEIDITNQNDIQKQKTITDFKDVILTMTEVKLIDESEYKYDFSQIVYRFLFKIQSAGSKNNG